MEYKAKRRTLKVDIDGTAYQVRFPKFSELELFEDKNKENPKEALRDFLVTLGLPLDAQSELEAIDLKEIVEIISGQKKIE
jgi:hypothetical protein